MKKNICVYIVMREEEQSDYVEKVFADKEKAEAHAAQFGDNPYEYARHVEEHQVDDGIAALLTIEDILGILAENSNISDRSCPHTIAKTILNKINNETI